MVPCIKKYEAEIEGMTDQQAKVFLLDQMRHLCPDQREFLHLDDLGIKFTKGQRVLLGLLHRHQPECCSDAYLSGALSNSLESSEWICGPNLKQRVYYLRQALASLPSWQIRRHRGVGYSLKIEDQK